MAAVKRVRWACPTGAHPGVLGPSRPRKDNICRYCLPCSQKAGKLVERVAPALEAKRAVESVKAKEKREAAAVREYEREFVVHARDAAGVEHRVDLPALLAQFARMECFQGTPVGAYFATKKKWAATLASGNNRLSVRRRTVGAHVSGRAWYAGRIVLTIPAKRASYEEVLEVALHELVHVAVRGRTAHDMAFKRKQMEAMFAAFPQISGRLGSWDLTEGAYVLDRKVQAAMRAACREAYADRDVPQVA